MKTHLVLLPALLTVFSLQAQVEWRGGFPGRETDWLCARNWSDNRVPDDLDNVVIPDCSGRGAFYPEIRSRSARVQTLRINSGAAVSILAGAKLTVAGYGLPGGALFNLGKLENNGTLEVIEPVLHAVDYHGAGTFIHRRSDLQPDICSVNCF